MAFLTRSKAKLCKFFIITFKTEKFSALKKVPDEIFFFFFSIERSKSQKSSATKSGKKTAPGDSPFTAWLPDGLFSNPKSKFG
jgi:hypothetical protein